MVQPGGLLRMTGHGIDGGLKGVAMVEGRLQQDASGTILGCFSRDEDQNGDPEPRTRTLNPTPTPTLTRTPTPTPTPTPTLTKVDYAINACAHHVDRLREMSPLWEMVQEGIDIKSIQWSQH